MRLVVLAVVLLSASAVAAPKQKFLCTSECVPIEESTQPPQTSSCIIGSTLGDGCPEAPKGAAPAPGLFSSGTGGVGKSYNFRPAWNVAGVEYRVGYDTTVTLKDPTQGGFPSCASADAGAQIVYVNSPCVIEGYDFAMGTGWKLTVNDACTNGTVTIRNNNFVMGAKHGNGGGSLIWSNGGTTCDMVVEKNVIDGASCLYNASNSIGALVSANANVKNTTVRYNQFLNSPQHGVALNYTKGTAASPAKFTSQYNYYRSMGNYNTTSNHANPYIFNNFAGGAYAITVQYDTYAQSSIEGDKSAVGVCPANKPFAQLQGGISALAYLDQGNANSATAQVDHNVFISQDSSTIWVSYIMRAGSASNALGPITGAYTDNWIDPAATYGPQATGSLPNPQNFRIERNTYLKTGGPCNSNSGNSCGP